MSQYEFQRNFAVIIGINEYKNDIPPLETAVSDASELAEILKDYKYDVRLLLDKEASMAGFNQLLAVFKQGEIPFEGETVKLGDNDRVLFYFAGHGIAVDAVENEEGPAGYLVPSNAQSGNVNSFVQMQELHNALITLPCRHLLIILDCCFAGAFRWSSGNRNAVRLPTVYKERYERFIRDRAWQVITSAAHDQKALDFLVDRGQVEQHSPFAAALFQALRGDADMYFLDKDGDKDGKPVSDGVITATELYVYLRQKLQTATEKLHSHQTPGLYQLAKHDKGEYVFLVPGHELNLPHAPTLNRENNPYRGLESFEEVHSELFFGREELKQELSAFVCVHQLTVVLGSSGTGKSSLVKAGLIPKLRISQQWHILDPIRPGKSPFAALQSVISQQLSVNSYQSTVINQQLSVNSYQLSLVIVVSAWCKANPQKKLLLVIDQFEELVTMCQNDKERKQFLSQLEEALTLPQFHVVLTLRSDFEPQFLTSAFPTRWMDSRFVVRPMTQDDFREVIEKPAAEKVLYFEPVDLIDDLINEVVQMPGALPLLSFTLSELYFKYLERRGDNRSLTKDDYKELGGVAGSLTQRATQEYENLIRIDPNYEYTIRKVMLRMVTVDGGGLARRRVPLGELKYPDSKENERIQEVIQRFTAARLLVSGTETSGEPYVEPAHDALMRGWNLLQKWRSDRQEIKGLMLRQRLTPAALDWCNFNHEEDYLWSHDPRLVTLEKVLKAPDHKNWLNQLETEFVESSLEKRLDELEETKKRLRISEERQQIAQARLLAAQAQLIQREDVGLLQSSILLAVESINRFNRLETKYLLADQTIRQGLSLLPRPITKVTRCSDRGYVCAQSFAFCSDGNMASATDAIRLLEIPTGKEIATLKYDNDLKIATVSPDGRYAATCGEDNVVKIWLLRQREVVQSLHHKDVQNIIFSPDNRYILIISNGLRRVWQLTSSFAVIPVKIPLTKLPAFFSGTGPISFSPNGNYLAEFVEDSPDSLEGRRLVWELASGRLIIHETVNLSSPFGSEENLTVWENVDDMAFSLDSQYFVATVTVNTVKVWKLPLGEEMMTVENSAWINTIAISANGQYVAAGDRKGEATIWEVPNGYQVIHITDNPTTWLGQVIFSPNGKYLATAGRGFNKIARVYDLPSGREVARMIHENYVLNIAISPDNKYIATQEDNNPEKSYSDTVRLWQVVDDFDGKAIVQVDAETIIDNISISSQGKYLGITYNQSDRFQVYQVDSEGEILANININHEGIHYAAFSPNEEFVATVSNDNTVRFWEIASGQELPLSVYYDESIIEIAFQDEKYLTTLANLTSIYIDNMDILVCDAIVWDITTSTQVKRIENTKVVSMSPDGKFLALLENSDSQEKTLLVQEILGGEKILRIKLKNQELSEFTLSADGKYLAGFGGFYGSETSVDSDGMMQVWDLSSGEEVLPLIKLGRAVTEIVFSPGSRLLAAVVGDTVRIWDLLSKQEVARLEVYGGVNHVIFHWDSQSLVSVNYLNQVQLWNLQPEVLIEEACHRLTCNLTEEEWQLYLGDEPYRKTCQNLP